MVKNDEKLKVTLWSRLRTRMAVSYVLVTMIIVLLLESLVVTVGFLIFRYSPFLGYVAMERANQAGKIFAYQAAVQGGGSTLEPDLTFKPGQRNSLSLRQENDPPQLSYFHLEVPYIEPGSPAPDRPTIAILIGLDEKVIASSYPERFPTSQDAARLLNEDELALIRGAMAGTPDGIIQETRQGRAASIASPVLSSEEKPLGAIFIQTPAGGVTGTNLVSQVSSVVIPSGLVGLCLMLPIGLIFGALTTRSLVRRIERLAGAAARYKDGDLAQRVSVKRQDEIGQLEQQFNTMAEQLIDSFAQRQAIAEESARREERGRIEQEMDSARYIQKSLLPERAPDLPGWQIEPFYRPARQVGGDLYDFLPLPGGRLGIVIGDITGKGMPAALIMATTCAMIRAAAPGAASPGEVLALVNDLLQVHIPNGMFATCFYAILDPASGRLCFANAGHTLPYLSRNGDLRELRATGMPLGLMAGQSYPEIEVTIDQKDCILFHTDGLVEAHDPAQEMFGLPRLKLFLQDRSQKDGLIMALLSELAAFTGPDWEQEDDVTLVILRRMG